MGGQGGILGRNLLDATAVIPHHRRVMGHHSNARIRGNASIPVAKCRDSIPLPHDLPESG